MYLNQSTVVANCQILDLASGRIEIGKTAGSNGSRLLSKPRRLPHGLFLKEERKK